MKIYTIGYGGCHPQEFLNLLKQHQIRAIVDVRLRPDRSSMGAYARAKSADKGIAALLAGAGIAYYSFIELGNVFLDYSDWQQRYTQLLDTSGELLIERLNGIPAPYCLMCAEKRVQECHRRQIAGYLMQRKNYDIEHIE